jgi:DNA (cytosine-5)-methyltransferase 1
MIDYSAANGIIEMLRGVSTVDLFCGAGGLSHGFFRERIHVNAGLDMDPACRFPFEENNGGTFIEVDVRDLKPEDVSRLYPKGDVKILAGCAPCQPFSTYKQRNGGQKDERWSLLYHFATLVEGFRPEIVMMENVPNLAKHDVFHDFVRRLETCGYSVSYSVVSCQEYAVPQSRTRLVLLASSFGPIHLQVGSSDSKTWISVKQAIGDLRPLNGGETDSTDHLHKAQNLSEINLRRIRASKPGGTWRDWPLDLRTQCHRKNSGKTYVSVYGRMEWDKPSPTITTQCYNFGSGRFGHPEQDRAISLREAAILQSFPKEYRFAPPDKPISIRKLSVLIGNAVPVELGAAIARSIKKHLKKHPEKRSKSRSASSDKKSDPRSEHCLDDYGCTCKRHFQGIVIKHPEDAKFLKGWTRRAMA